MENISERAVLETAEKGAPNVERNFRNMNLELFICVFTLQVLLSQAGRNTIGNHLLEILFLLLCQARLLSLMPPRGLLTAGPTASA